MHHPGYLESFNRWFAGGEKQALDLRGQLHVLKQVVTLLPNYIGKRLPLLDIPLDEVNKQRRSTTSRRDCRRSVALGESTVGNKKSWSKIQIAMRL